MYIYIIYLYYVYIYMYISMNQLVGHPSTWELTDQGTYDLSLVIDIFSCKEQNILGQLVSLFGSGYSSYTWTFKVHQCEFGACFK